MRHKVGTTGVTFKKYTSKSPAPLPVPHELARPTPTQCRTQTQKHLARAPHASDTRPTGQLAQTTYQTKNNNARALHARTTHPGEAQTHTTGPSHRAPLLTNTQTQVTRTRKLVHFDKHTKFTETRNTAFGYRDPRGNTARAPLAPTRDTVYFGGVLPRAGTQHQMGLPTAPVATATAPLARAPPLRAHDMGQPTDPTSQVTVPAATDGLGRYMPAERAPEHNLPTACGSPHQLAQGKRRRLMNPEPWMRFHPFISTLEQWSLGVSAQCGNPWDSTAIDAAVARGPHTSALTPAARQLIAEEIAYQVAAGFSEIVAWSDIQTIHPPQLKISPLAVIPQEGRRGRLLLDLSFAVQAPCASRGKRGRYNATPLAPLAPSVNTTTLIQSPVYPVKELGRVLPRLFNFMASVPVEETIMFAKIDLSDGFWRMLVAETDKWNFAYVLPQVAGQPLQLVIPHALQMGWTESPGYFCAATETGRDILQALIDAGTVIPPHVFDHFMTPNTPARRQTSPDAARPWQMSAVYVDDYILAAVENRSGTALAHAGRAALHTIHGLFPAPHRSGHTNGKDPISLKKLEAGDARWAPSKELLPYA